MLQTGLPATHLGGGRQFSKKRNQYEINLVEIPTPLLGCRDSQGCCSVSKLCPTLCDPHERLYVENELVDTERKREGGAS